jgi:predicted nucleotidyltransferase
MTSLARTLPLAGAARTAVDEHVAWLRVRFGERLREVKLFGSRARGEAHEHSDVDLLVMVDELTSVERREVGDHAAEALLRFDVLLAPLALSSEHFAQLRERGRTLAREVDGDGISL